jgi:hypothetical protein
MCILKRKTYIEMGRHKSFGLVRVSGHCFTITEALNLKPVSIHLEQSLYLSFRYCTDRHEKMAQLR